MFDQYGLLFGDFDFPWRVPALSGATDLGQDDLALVWRYACGVDNVHVVLSSAVVRRLCLRSCAHESLQATRPGITALGPVDCGGMFVAHHASAAWKPTDGSQPAARILLMLLACVGLQYFLLSATSPLIQTWFAHANPGKSPYRLYALSNVGSLGALLLYPIAIEPTIGTIQQGWLWSLGFGLFTAVAAIVARQLVARQLVARQLVARQTVARQSSAESVANQASTKKTSQQSSIANAELSRTPSAEDCRATVSAEDCRATEGRATEGRASDRLTWLFLPALASMMLLAVTNHLCQDVAVVPFLWIAPLALYLISLIICFDRDQWYKSGLFAMLAIFVILFACDMAFTAYVYQDAEKQPRWVFWIKYDIRLLLSVYLSLFFLACMLCHGEVVRRRPLPQRLTEFYLTISAGGALGGFFVAIVCPLIFTTFQELKIGIFLTFVLAVVVLLRQLGVFAKPSNVDAVSKTKASKKRKSKSPVEIKSSARPRYQLSSSLRYLIVVLGGVLIVVVGWLNR